MHGEQVVILMPSCDSYARMAGVTTSLVARYWDSHPRLTYCGLSVPGDNRLRLRAPPADWIGIVLDAVEDLKTHGARWCYLVLDDHPPLARCHSGHLNITLPRLMEELDAACINLNGWGRGRDGRRPIGVRLEGRYYRMERLPANYAWSYSLHPALWNLDSLGALLRVLVDTLPPGERSPWRFEREAARAAGALPEGVARQSFRVCGGAMTGSRTRWLTHLAVLSALRATRRGTRLAGARVQRGLTAGVDLAGQYYEGPFPLFWSGAVQAGRVNQALIRFLCLSGRRALARKLIDAAPAQDQAA